MVITVHETIRGYYDPVTKRSYHTASGAASQQAIVTWYDTMEKHGDDPLYTNVDVKVKTLKGESITVHKDLNLTKLANSSVYAKVI